MDNRMNDIDRYIYMKNGTIVYESIYEKQFTPEEFQHLLALCEDWLDIDEDSIDFNAVIDEWENEGC